MDSSFASTMNSALDELKSSFESFSSSTFTDEVWYGDASDNAKTQINDKIYTKIISAKEKIEKLISAIAKAEEANNIQSEINVIGNKSYATEALRDAAQAEINEHQAEINTLIEEINSLCR